jgi:hypothetical protein
MSELNPIELVMHQPAHEQIFPAVGPATTVNVAFRGEIVSTTFPIPATLFRKWYSSLLGQPLGTVDQFTAALPVGSHTIAYTVKDKNEDGVPPEQLEPLFKSIAHIGVTGGPPDPPPADGRPCVIHVLVANILAPADNAVLSKSNATLEAQAPLQWGKYVQDAASFPELNPSYHALNKIRYRWFFRRIAPAGPPIELDVQGGNAMTLIPPHDTPLPKVDPPARLRYNGMLPEALVVGQQYTVTLRVEHATTPAQGHEASRTVTIVV